MLWHAFSSRMSGSQCSVADGGGRAIRTGALAVVEVLRGPADPELACSVAVHLSCACSVAVSLSKSQTLAEHDHEAHMARPTWGRHSLRCKAT